MINYDLLFEQIRIHAWWHNQLENIEQMSFYHRDSTCNRCNPPNQNTLQFDHFWNWFSGENPATGYTSRTQQALIELDNSITVTETWEAIYAIVFSIRYSIEPRPYTELHQELYNVYILTDTFRKDPFEEIYQISEAVPSTNSDNSSESLSIPDNFHPLFHDLLLQGPLTPGLLFTDKDLNLETLFGKESAGLLFTDEDLNLDLLFETEHIGLLFADKDLNLGLLF